MGTLIGHVLPGFGFILIGLWQLYNHIKLHCQHPKAYKPPTWFPFPRVRHLELYLIVFGSLTSVATELFIGPARHQPLDPADWTIPTNHLHNFEHATGSLSIFIYGAFSLHLDRVRPRAGQIMALLIAANSFAMQFLMFYLHSTDHTGLEWQYHWLLQTILVVALITTLLGIGHPRSFAVGFTRSVSVLFQGVWSNVLGIMLYTPQLVPKGCRLQSDDGFLNIPCDGPASLHRAKSLANLQFAWSFVAVVVFSGWFYLHLAKKYKEEPEFEYLGKEEGKEDELPQSPKKKLEEEQSRRLFLDVQKHLEPMSVQK